MDELIITLVIAALVIIALTSTMTLTTPDQLNPDEQKDYYLTQRWGKVNDSMICPHCQSRGVVRTHSVERKKGVSGSKATAALFTAGISLLATGLSRKENETQAHCCRCNNTWHF